MAGEEAQLHSLVNSVLDEDERLASRPSHLTSGQDHQYPLNRKLGVPQIQSGLFGEEIKLLPLLEFKPWTLQPVA